MSSSSSFTNTPSQNPSQFTKLTADNYLVWLRQIKPYLKGAKLWGYVDGTKTEPAPTKIVPARGDTPAITEPSPDYEDWHTVDQQIVSILNTSLSLRK